MVPKLAIGLPGHSVMCMNATQNHAFNELLAAWRRREDARRSGDIRSLGDARVELDRRRADMRSILDATR